MISIKLQIFITIAIFIYFALIIVFLKKKALSLKYTLLWLFSGVGMGILIVFPQIMDYIVQLIDIKSPVNGLFAFCIFFIIMILMSLTSIVSKQSSKIKELAQYISFLEKRIREVEKYNQEGNAND